MKLPNDVDHVIQKYPAEARRAFLNFRKMVLDVAKNADIANLEETLKWGEPSFVCKTGSTLRADWKPKQPDALSLFTNCKSQLMETIVEIYPSVFDSDGRRELRLPLSESWPEEPLKHLILLSLTYHRVKHLPLLGA